MCKYYMIAMAFLVSLSCATISFADDKVEDASKFQQYEQTIQPLGTGSSSSVYYGRTVTPMGMNYYDYGVYPYHRSPYPYVQYGYERSNYAEPESTLVLPTGNIQSENKK